MLESLIGQYGYLAVLVGTFLEGETILVIAGFLAHRGYLSLDGVMLAAFLGTYAGDQLFFQIGRRRGVAWLERRPGWRTRAERVFRLLERYQTPVVLGFRFLYGIRNVTPFVIGASGFPTWRFVLLNGIGAAIWAIVIATLGYLLGESASRLIDRVMHYEALIVAVVAVIGTLAWGLFLWRRRARSSG